jgi:uncharacterized membrane protein
VTSELGYKPDKIISEVIKLQGEKKILIREPTPYRTFANYLLSPVSFWFWESALAVLVSIGLIFASSGWTLYLRFIFGSLLVLLLPGYSLVGLIYFRKNDLDYPTRVLLSFVLSLALTTLVGLALNFTMFGIDLFAVALSLGIITIGLLVLTALRKFSVYRFETLMTQEQ